jgi:serpin B
MGNMRLGAGLLALALFAAACGTSDETPALEPSTTADPGTHTEEFTAGEEISLDTPRAAPAVSDADIAAVVAGDTAFGLDLLRTTAGDENLMLSPYSIATALSMLYPGARGPTATEIADVLHLSVDDATLHAVRNYIDTSLATPPDASADGDPFTVRPANSAWGQGGYPFRDEYLAVLAEHYGTGLRLLDYAGDPDGSRSVINDWVKDATEDRIKDLIPQGAITTDTRLTLVNAIWFKASWIVPFDPELTDQGTFTLLDGTEIEVPLMHSSVRTGYADADQFQAIRLPYAGDAAMVVLLPKSGSPADLAAALDPEDLDIVWRDHQVQVTLPSFAFEAELGLKSALQALGMRTAFEAPVDGGADLTAITSIRELFVSDAFHKTFISLDEEGTEAAAATALVVGLTSLLSPATFTADRPFLFWIEQSSTGEILFLGQVTNPA